MRSKRPPHRGQTALDPPARAARMRSTSWGSNCSAISKGTSRVCFERTDDFNSLPVLNTMAAKRVSPNRRRGLERGGENASLLHGWARAIVRHGRNGL